MAISSPMIVLSCILAVASGQFLWLALLVIPTILVISSIRISVEASSILVQAIVLKMVEPPVLERLTEQTIKSQEHPETETDKHRLIGSAFRYFITDQYVPVSEI